MTTTKKPLKKVEKPTQEEIKAKQEAAKEEKERLQRRNQMLSQKAVELADAELPALLKYSLKSLEQRTIKLDDEIQRLEESEVTDSNAENLVKKYIEAVQTNSALQAIQGRIQADRKEVFQELITKADKLEAEAKEAEDSEE